MSTHTDQKRVWEEYCVQELSLLTPLLSVYGYTLDVVQPHIAGERYLMQAVTTAHGKKLILLGENDRGEKVVIKATRDPQGAQELLHEQRCRNILTKIDFAGEVFHMPREVAFIEEGGFTISIQLFIEQASTFLERPLEEQFGFALRAFKGQESAHATTWNHRALVGKHFEIRDSETYLERFKTFKGNILRALPDRDEMHALLDQALLLLAENKEVIEQYTGFLTHTDFVPHNIRIYDNTIYLLDHSSLTFGNKYEGWARFVNFMTLYNPPLSDALVTYVRENRTPEESTSLRMMRVYRLGEILWYYTETLEKSEGNLQILNSIRVDFWSAVLSSVLKNEPVPESVLSAYKEKRDTLRSDDEKRRQQGLH